MSIVLCLSSQVVRGFVGGSAARIALGQLGHECWLLPTVILSNHPGYARFAGEQVPPGRLRAMLEALEANGWLGDVDAVMTGYMPSPEHVALAASMIAQVKQAHGEALYLCDPILGDSPGGLYVDEEVASAIRDELIPLADIATPNRFELEWLSGKNSKRAKTALSSACELGPAMMFVTSLTGNDPQTLVNLLADGKGAWQTQIARRKGAPHGVGDLNAALFLGHLLNGSDPCEALGRATAGVEAALEASKDADELRLTTGADWATAEAWPVEAVPKK